MSKKKKAVVAFIGILVVSLMVVYAVKHKKTSSEGDAELETVYVQTGAIEKGALESVIYTKGDVISKESAAVSPEINGTVETVFVKEGDSVVEGDPLLKFDTAAIDKSIRDAKLQLQIAEANLANSVTATAQEKSATQTQQETTIRNAKLVYENALKSYEETTALFEAGVVSEKEKDSSKLAYDQAYNAYMDAQNVKSTKNDTTKVTALQLEAARNTYNDLISQKEKYTLRAPINGVVTKLSAKAFDALAPLTPIATIETVSDLQIKTSIGEYDIANIEVGMTVRITGNAVGDAKYEGKIESVGTVANVQGNERTVPVTVSLEGETAFKPNYTADLEIVFASVKDAYLIPYEAWQNNKEGDFIYTIKEGKAVKHPVTIGVKGEIQLEVKGDGFDENAVLIIKPPLELKDGSAVSVVGGEK